MTGSTRRVVAKELGVGQTENIDLVPLDKLEHVYYIMIVAEAGFETVLDSVSAVRHLGDCCDKANKIKKANNIKNRLLHYAHPFRRRIS